MKKIIAAFFMALVVMLSPQMDMKANSFALKCVEEKAALEPACLPIAGRMVRDQKAACHCPPQDRCPNTAADWKSGKIMPTDVATICCDMPDACTFKRTTLGACGSAAGVDTTKKDAFCFKHTLIDTVDKTTDDYSKFLVRMNAIDAALKKLDDELEPILQVSAKTQADYTTAEAVYVKIEAQNLLLKKLEADIEAFNKASGSSKQVIMKCELNSNEGEVTFCNERVAAACPAPPNGGGGGGDACVKMRGDLDPNHFLDANGNFQDDNEKAKAYEASVKDKCPKVQWQDCVAEGSMVTMADGSKRKIQDIRVGEFVKGYNANNKVTGISLEDYAPNKLFTINNDGLHITGGHPILTVAGWKAINPEDVQTGEAFGKIITKLVEGDEIIIADEATVKVKSLTPYTGAKVATYNLSVNGDYTFIANGLVVRAYKNSTQY